VDKTGDNVDCGIITSMAKGLQKKADNLLTPIIKKLHPVCLLCPSPTQVAHHFIHKSKSSALRYDLENLINLCNHCHCALHFGSESEASASIAFLKGKKWFAYIQSKKYATQKINKAYYESILEKLSAMI
jgi:5-methylcytosine-specific restriction endonuclease McrA